MKTLDTHELAWAAGLFDGEGHTGTKHGRRKTRRPRSSEYYRSITMDIRQIDRRVLDRFAAAVGIGSVSGPYGPYGTQGRPAFVYSANGHEDVQAVVARLWRWLSAVKREQAVRALATFRSLPDLSRATRNPSRDPSTGRYAAAPDAGVRA